MRNNPWFKPWFNILLHTQSIIHTMFKVLGIYNFVCTYVNFCDAWNRDLPKPHSQHSVKAEGLAFETEGQSHYLISYAYLLFVICCLSRVSTFFFLLTISKFSSISAESQLMLYWKHGAKLGDCKKDKIED